MSEPDGSGGCRLMVTSAEMFSYKCQPANNSLMR